VITPHLKGLENWNHLSYASSLCGNCTEVCPVKIDLHHHLLRNRRNAVGAGLASGWERLAFRLWLWGMKSPARYNWLARLARLGEWCFRAAGMDRRSFANPVRGWTQTRVLPRLARQSFKQWWQQGGSTPDHSIRAPG
jgi:L-lactate dehydrogenase complex protein LldF